MPLFSLETLDSLSGMVFEVVVDATFASTGTGLAEARLDDGRAVGAIFPDNGARGAKLTRHASASEGVVLLFCFSSTTPY